MVTASHKKIFLETLEEVKNGNFEVLLPTNWKEEDGEIATALNQVFRNLHFLTTQILQVTQAPDTTGVLGATAQVEQQSGKWKEIIDSVNNMSHNLTLRVRELSSVSEAALQGNFSKKIEMKANGEILELKNRLQRVFDQMHLLTAAHAKAEQDQREKIEELERFKTLTVGRELKMVALKKELEACKKGTFTSTDN